MYIYGKNVTKETIQEKKEKIYKAYVSKTNRNKEIINLLKENNIKIDFVDKFKLDKLANGNHQGFVLEIDDIKTYELDEIENLKKENATVVILDHLEDPHNFGAIIRTAEALGIDAIIIPNKRSVGITSTVIKTSAGAINYIKIIRVANLSVAITKLKKNGFWIIGTDMEGEDYTKIDYNTKIGLIIGNEGHGMGNTIRNSCDFVAKIPMTGKINSLNASVSCAIFLAEITNQRNTHGNNI